MRSFKLYDLSNNKNIKNYNILHIKKLYREKLYEIDKS
jgi:hypothetical protein